MAEQHQLPAKRVRMQPPSDKQLIDKMKAADPNTPRLQNDGSLIQNSQPVKQNTAAKHRRRAKAEQKVTNKVQLAVTLLMRPCLW